MNIIITNHSYDTVISGGDVIAAEFAKCWKNSGNIITIATHESGAKFFRSRGIENSMLAVTSGASSERFGVLVSALVKTMSAILQSIFWKGQKPDIIFSSSWMWTDFFPALILKVRFPRSKFVCGCYLLLGSPNTNSYGSSVLNRWTLWLVYVLGGGLMRRTADIVWTASPLDAENLHNNYGIKTYAVRGGVDVSLCRAARSEGKEFDAVFMGRFHPQKNILELIDIWKIVHSQMPEARLLLVGDGFLKNDINSYIKKLGLENVIKVERMLDGEEKFKTLASSRLCVSASHYDSGNLSLDEAMACGVPGIVYDIPLLYYPQGVIKIPCFEKTLFAQSVIDLLSNISVRERLSQEALDFGETLDWKIKAKNALLSLGF